MKNGEYEKQEKNDNMYCRSCASADNIGSAYVY